MTKDRYGLTARDALALDAAKLSLTGRTQRQIAAELFVDRATVSKLLTTARAKGLLHTEVRDPRELDSELRGGLLELFPLASVRLVAPVGRGPMDLRRSLGQAGAQVLGSLVQDGDRIGIWWSQTTAALALAAVPAARRGVRVVDLNGTDPRLSPHPTWKHARAVLVDRWGAASRTMRDPLVFPTLGAKLDAELDGDLRSLLTEQAACRIAVFGTTTAHALVAALPDPLPPEEAAAVAERAVGHVCGRLIDAGARIAAPVTNQRTTGISLPALRPIEQKVLVAGGPEKVPAMTAILANRYADHLITDTATAALLLGSRSAD